MKKINLISCIFALFIIPNVFAEDFPNIREGMWESTIDMPGGAGSKGSKNFVTKHCYGDKDSIKSIFESSKKAVQGFCSEMDVSVSGSTFTSSMSCDMGMSKMTIVSSVSGDFQTEYSMNTKTIFDPPMFGKSQEVTSGRARYLGPCETGTKPGDVIMADGKKMNLNEMKNNFSNNPEQQKKLMEGGAKLNEALKNIDPKQMEEFKKIMQNMGKK